jgi:predicted porin
MNAWTTKRSAAGAFAAIGSLLAANAGAQSLEIYGVLGMYAGSFKRSGDPAATYQLNGGGLNTSFIGLRGKEDLGGGLSTIFALESFYRPDTGEQGRSATDPLFSRNAWVGFEGNAGRLTFGRQTNPTYFYMSQLSPFGNSVVFSPLTLQSFVATFGSNIIGDTVWNNVIEYTTPLMKGFRGTALYGLGEVAGKPGIGNLGLHGSYVNGKFLAAVSWQRLRVNISTPVPAQQEAWLTGAAYDFGPVKLYGNVEHTNIDGGQSNRLFDAGLSIPVSPTSAVWLEAAQSRIEVPRAADTYRTTAALGYDYRLSKRTDVYAVYLYDRRTFAGSASNYAVALRHLF